MADEVKKDVVKTEEPKPILSVFITEDDIFDVTVEFYKDKGKTFVKDIDSDFDITKPTEKLNVTLKYPSQGDVDTIYSMAGRQVTATNPADISLPDFLRLELARLAILVRKWSAGVDITPEKIYQLNPKIVKGIIIKVRNEIGLEGII